MLTRKSLAALALAFSCASTLSHAGSGSASGAVECAGGWSGGGPVVMKVNYTIPLEDAGLPGAVFVGAYNPASGMLEAVLTESGWKAGTGGLIEPFRFYRDGVPASLQFEAEKPACETNKFDFYDSCTPDSTAPYAGYEIWVAHGVLTPDAEQIVQRRRAALEASRERLVQAGRWNSRYDDPAFDDEFRYALIQKDANGKHVRALVVPDLYCSSNN